MGDLEPGQSERGIESGHQHRTGRKLMSSTQISKVLAVAATTLSLAFLGFAFTVFLAGPNWRAEARDLPDYAFERAPGDPPTWTVTHRVSGETVASGANTLAEAVVQAHNDLQSRQQEELRQLDEQISNTESQIETSRELIAADRDAFDQRAAQLQDELNTLQQQIDQVASQVAARSQEAQDLQSEIRRRREEVLRLQNVLAELETDSFRAGQQSKELQDLLVRLKDQVRRLKQRNEQLQEQLGT